MKTQYFFSDTKDNLGESWTNGPHDSIDAAIKAGMVHYNLTKGQRLFVGELVPHVPHISASHLLEELQEQAHGECSDAADSWGPNFETPEVIQELEDSMNDVFQKWLTKHNAQPTCGAIVNIKAHKIP